MNNNDLPQFSQTVNNILAVYGKQPLAQGGIKVWWDTLKEFDHNAVFTSLSYWPQHNAKPPVPHDLWKQLNESRTSILEEKARVERLENTGRKLPEGYGPTQAGRVMMRILKDFLQNSKIPVWHRVLDSHENGEAVPPSMLAWARNIEESTQRGEA